MGTTELEDLRKTIRTQRYWNILAVLIAGSSLLFTWSRTSKAPSVPTSLTVSELAVVDSAGVVRARLSGAAPDPVIKGHQVARGGQAAGLIIYDASGQERGGYVTFDDPSANAMLTLDTRNGQVAYFVADPEHGVALRLWTAEHAVELRADSSGAHTAVVQDGSLLIQTPPLGEAEVQDLCGSMKEEIAALSEVPPYDELLVACAQRMTREDCERCLQEFRK